ncbi:hypothetical protein D3C87_2179920 [compost metagenome]
MLELQVGAGHRVLAPGWTLIRRIAVLMPPDGDEALIETAEKMPALLLIDELTEELSIALFR